MATRLMDRFISSESFRLTKFAERVSRWGTAPLFFVLAMVPLIVRLKSQEPSVELGELRWAWPLDLDLFHWWKSRAVLLSAGIGLFMLPFCFASPRKEFPRVVAICVPSYLALLALSTWWSRYPQLALYGLPGLQEGALVLASYLILFLLAVLCFQSIKALDGLSISLTISSLLVSLVGFFQMSGHSLFFLPPFKKMIFGAVPDGEFTQVLPNTFSTLYHSNYLGSFVALTVPFFLVPAKNGRPRLLAAVVVTFLLIMLFGSGSRAGLLGMLTGAIVVFAVKRPFSKKKEKWVAFTLLILVLGFLAVKGSHLVAKLNEAVQEMVGLAKPSSGWSGFQFFKVSGGKAILVAANTDIVVTGNPQGLRFHRVTGEAIPFRRQGDSLVLEHPALDKLEVDLKRTKNDLPYFTMSIGGETVKLVPTQEGIKALAWKRGFDSEEPERTPWISDKLFSHRGYIWSRTLPLMKWQWLRGPGPATFPLYFPQRDFFGKMNIDWPFDLIVDRPHSLYLQIAHGTGWLSLMVLLILFGEFFRRAARLLRADKENHYLLACTASTAGYLVAGIFNDSTLGVAPLFWIILGAGWACLQSTPVAAKVPSTT